MNIDYYFTVLFLAKQKLIGIQDTRLRTLNNKYYVKKISQKIL